MYGETALQIVGDEQLIYEWHDYGFIIEVPKGALAPGVTAIMNVKVVVATKIKLPSENTQLTSALYWISCSEEFLEEVTVKIQHSAVIKSEAECSGCRFIIARCSQDQLIFKERVGTFKSDTEYAAINLKKFSVIAASSLKDTEVSYSVRHFYKPIPGTSRVDFKLVVVRNKKPHLKVNAWLCL